MFKLIFSSALDPAGIKMLRSITDLFSMVQIDLNTINFKIEKIDDLVKERALQILVKILFILYEALLFKILFVGVLNKAIEVEKKSPAVVGAKFDIETWEVESIHVMLATGIKRDADEILIQCKNTYRDENEISDLLDIPLRYGSKNGAGAIGWWLGSSVTAFYISFELE